MGRHAAPELDSPTVVIPRIAAAPPRYVAEGRTDFATWWQGASMKRRARLGVLLAAPVVASSAFFISETNASAHRTAVYEATSDARDQGVQHAADLRNSGYSSMTVMSRCSINDGGYGGAYWEDYSDGCTAVALQMMQKGQ